MSGTDISCDRCDSRFWLCCVGLTEVPTNDWYCSACAPSQTAPAAALRTAVAHRTAAVASSTTAATLSTAAITPIVSSKRQRTVVNVSAKMCYSSPVQHQHKVARQRGSSPKKSQTLHQTIAAKKKSKPLGPDDIEADEHTPMVQYTASENEQPSTIARKHEVTSQRLIECNQFQYPELRPSSRLKRGTVLLLPPETPDSVFKKTNADVVASEALKQITDIELCNCPDSCTSEVIVICESCNKDHWLCCVNLSEPPNDEWYCSDECKARGASDNHSSSPEKPPRSDGKEAKTPFQAPIADAASSFRGPMVLAAPSSSSDGSSPTRSSAEQQQTASESNLPAESLLTLRKTSAYRGVSWSTDAGKWSAHIYINGQRKELGHSDSEKQAAQMYDQECSRAGYHAKTNFQTANSLAVADAASALSTGYTDSNDEKPFQVCICTQK